MKSIYKFFIFSLLSSTISACSPDPLDSEQYQNEVYLIGAYNKTWTINVKYEEDKHEDYFTVSSSGSLNINQDAHIVAEINDDIVDSYNRKYIGIDNTEAILHNLDQDLYDIPGIDKIVIDHTKGISVKVPIFINSKNLNPDWKYAIPIQIVSSTPYKVNDTGKKMIILFNLLNDYSGNYQVDGQRTEVSGTITPIKRAKKLTATGVNKVRLFYGINNEGPTMAEKKAKTIEITILDEFIAGSTTIKKVTVAGWGDVVITDFGDGTYDTINKEFSITYTVDGIKHIEKITKNPETII